jgi:hypothetical protein
MNKLKEEWKNHNSRMIEDKTVRVVRDTPPKGGRSPGRHLKRVGMTLSAQTGGQPNYKKEEEEKEEKEKKEKEEKEGFSIK